MLPTLAMEQGAVSQDHIMQVQKLGPQEMVSLYWPGSRIQTHLTSKAGKGYICVVKATKFVVIVMRAPRRQL